MFIPVPAGSMSTCCEELFTGTKKEALPFANKALKVIDIQPFFISLAKTFYYKTDFYIKKNNYLNFTLKTKTKRKIKEF